MAALLNATQYKNPQAQILYGAGNKDISDATIKAFINTPGRTAAEVKGAALNYGVNTDQISRAMSGNKDFSSENIDKYLVGEGVTRDTVEPPLANKPLLQQVVPPASVQATPITVGKNDTVAGQMSNLLENQNSPMNVQAQTFGNQTANRRGLLNSSIAVSAAQDASYKNAMPIATQDAATNFSANQQNSQQGLQASMFNNDVNSRVGMFNAGMNKDVQINRENLDMNKYIADMDTNSKLQIANIQAMANDSGIMGDLGKSMMDLYQRTASDPNMSPDVKRETIANLTSQFSNLTGLLPSFKKIAPLINFGADAKGAASGAIGTTGTTAKNDGSIAIPGQDGKVGSPGSMEPNSSGVGYKIYAQNGLRPVVLNSADYKFDPSEVTSIRSSLAAMGRNIDMNDIAPQSLINEINRMRGGQVGTPDPRFFVPVPIPGSLRGDNLAFSLYKSALPKYQ